MNINISIKELKSIIKGQCSLDDAFVIKGIASLEGASQDQLTVLMDRGDESVFSPIDKEKIKRTDAGLILAKEEVISGKPYFITPDPLSAYHAILRFIEAQKGDDALIDSSAQIDKTAQIGQNTKIGALCVVGKHVVIGNNVVLHSGVTVLDRCTIGDNTIIHSGAVIGSDGFGYSVTKMGLQKIPQIGIVEVGKHAEIGANCCIDRATFEKTVIGNGVKLDNLVHIAHNAIVGDHSVILAHTAVAGGVRIGFGCQIGGQVAIKDHVTIGNKVKIVSKSAVMKDLPDAAVVCGIPSMPFLQWKRMSVMMTKLPEMVKEFGKLKGFLEKRKKGFWSRFF